jgi:hypothetical protein
MDIVMRNNIAPVALTALTANTAKALEFSESDDKIVLVVNNTGSAAVDLTVKAGNGIQGVCDLVLSAPKGVSLLKLESGRFKNVTGENKGKIVVISTGTPSVGIVALV